MSWIRKYILERTDDWQDKSAQEQLQAVADEDKPVALFSDKVWSTTIQHIPHGVNTLTAHTHDGILVIAFKENSADSNARALRLQHLYQNTMHKDEKFHKEVGYLLGYKHGAIWGTENDPDDIHY